MKIHLGFETNLRIKEVQNEVKKATKESLKDVVVAIANDAIKGSPKLTGNNARSIKYDIGPNRGLAKNEGEAVIYSTSGYGGYLETGTVKMDKRPYFKPALDKNIGKLTSGIKARLR